MTTQVSEMRSLRQISGSIEYTDLRKTITYRDVETMCMEAALYGFGTIVVASALVQYAATCNPSEGPSIATVLSFPFGTQAASVKAREAAVAVEHGAHELDLVPHFGAILAERWNDVNKEFAEIRSAAGAATLKLVLETGRLSSTQTRETCAIAADNGFDYVTNTLGFRLVSTDPGAEGSASVQTVRSLSSLAGDSLKIKAVGGVTTLQTVNDLLDAGAHRVALNVLPGTLRAMGWTLDTKKEKS